MAHKFKPIDLRPLKTYSITDRKSKVSVTDFAKTWTKGYSFSDFIDSLPDMLAAKDLKAVIVSIVNAFKNNKIVVFGMGAHVTKVGLNPCNRPYAAWDY